MCHAGYIIDCAFTIAFDPQFDPLLEATREATYKTIHNAGVDARLGELGGEIEEIITSYEADIYGRTYPSIHGFPVLRSRSDPECVGTLDGEGIDPRLQSDSAGVRRLGRENGGRRDFRHRNLRQHRQRSRERVGNDVALRAERDERVSPAVGVETWNHLRRTERETNLLAHLKRTFDTLPFCRRWLDREDGGSFAVNGSRGRQRKCVETLNELVRKGVVEVGARRERHVGLPAAVRREGQLFVAAGAHAFGEVGEAKRIECREDCKEIFSMGNDF